METPFLAKVFVSQSNYPYKTILLLDLTGCDVVLKVDWLRIIGSIIWNFVDLARKIHYNNKEFQLRGLSPTESTL
jgi:hypothetical protein